MREKHSKTIEHVLFRTEITRPQLRELAMLMASQFGPITISSLIEFGLAEFRKKKAKKKK